MHGDEQNPPASKTFIVERFWPRIADVGLDAVLPYLERAARTLTASGRRVEHVGSHLMPGDHVVFSVINAGSEDIVREACELAGLPFDRVAEATPHGFKTSGFSPSPAGRGGKPRRVEDSVEVGGMTMRLRAATGLGYVGSYDDNLCAFDLAGGAARVARLKLIPPVGPPTSQVKAKGSSYPPATVRSR